MLSPTSQFLSRKLKEQQESGLLRQLRINKDQLIDFASNDYLGLARSEGLFEKIETETRAAGIQNGSTGSRLLTGNSSYIENTEEKLARIFEAEASLIFNSGYTANLAVLSSLPQKGDTILYDELAHASIKDGARLSLAKRFSFKHNNPEDLKKKIQKASGRVYIAVESVYSMDGDFCPLQDITEIAERYEACVVLDEAHSTGIMGSQGNGMATSLGLSDRIPIRIYTFGKGMGIHGACVTGNQILKEYLLNFARPFVYTTAPDLHSVAAISCAFDYLGKNIHLQTALQKNIAVFLDAADAITNKTRSESPIQTFIVPGNIRIKEIALELKNNEIDVRPILSPTVAKGSERLRICLHAFNREEEIMHLCSFLQKTVVI